MGRVVGEQGAQRTSAALEKRRALHSNQEDRSPASARKQYLKAPKMLQAHPQMQLQHTASYAVCVDHTAPSPLDHRSSKKTTIAQLSPFTLPSPYPPSQCKHP